MTQKQYKKYERVTKGGFLMPKRRKKTLEQRVEQLKKEAEEKGLLNNLLYEELLDDFVYQTNLMRRLRAEIDGGELTTQKTYVKNNPNTSPNKLIATYNATSNARVNTVSAIAKIVKSFGESDGDNPDPLLNIINGGEDYDADGE
jgi:hypothetical protein